MNQGRLFAAYLRLTALRSNLPDHPQVHAKYVEDFHAIVDLLTDLSGLDLDGFRLPLSDYLRADAGASGDIFCERSLLAQSIDALLGCFQVQFSPPGLNATSRSATHTG
jgi:hypothetical protein